MRKSKTHIVFILLVMILAACMPNRKAAVSFLDQRENISVMLVPPAFTFLYYYPLEGLVTIEPGAAAQNLSESHFLKDADTNRAAEMFYQTLLSALRGYGINVFEPSQFDAFLAQPGQRFIFSVGQSEIIEYDREFTDRALYDDMLYRQDFLLRTLEKNTWFEFVKVDDSDPDSQMLVLYSTFFKSDEVNGRFRYYHISGEVFYEYTAKLLELDDVYELARLAGRSNARYIFEFLLNRHVAGATGSEITSPRFFRYNVVDGTLRRERSENRFIILDVPAENQ